MSFTIELNPFVYLRDWIYEITGISWIRRRRHLRHYEQERLRNPLPTEEENRQRIIDMFASWTIDNVRQSIENHSLMVSTYSSVSFDIDSDAWLLIVNALTNGGLDSVQLDDPRITTEHVIQLCNIDYPRHHVRITLSPSVMTEEISNLILQKILYYSVYDRYDQYSQYHKSLFPVWYVYRKNTPLCTISSLSRFLDQTGDYRLTTHMKFHNYVASIEPAYFDKHPAASDV